MDGSVFDLPDARPDPRGLQTGRGSGGQHRKQQCGRQCQYESEGTVDIFQFKVEINDALKAATETYMKTHPNVKINLETVGGGSDYGAALRNEDAKCGSA